jgi:hypothetical protein
MVNYVFEMVIYGSARIERVQKAREGLDERLVARLELIDSYAKVSCLGGIYALRKLEFLLSCSKHQYPLSTEISGSLLYIPQKTACTKSTSWFTKLPGNFNLLAYMSESS